MASQPDTGHTPAVADDAFAEYLAALDTAVSALETAARRAEPLTWEQLTHAEAAETRPS